MHGCHSSLLVDQTSLELLEVPLRRLHALRPMPMLVVEPLHEVSERLVQLQVAREQELVLVLVPDRLL